MSGKTKFFIILTVVMVLSAAGLTTWAAVDLYRFAHRPYGTATDEGEIFSVTPGESLDHICTRLQQSGLVSDARRFMFLVRLNRADKHLKAGEYLLTGPLPPIKLLETLVAGNVYLYPLTIPEGYTLRQIANELTRLQLTDTDQFLHLATDPEVVNSFGLQGQTLEGYLFPDTYHFPRGISPRTIIAKMVQRFKDQFPEAWLQREAELKMSTLEIVTLASIIEKETGDPSERPLISSVFHNRLKKGMRLETDPTVIYGLQDFDGNLTRDHLRTPTPYNTYIIKGLPPGPIANPGRSAIEAALYPAHSDYLYFVAKKDGTHQFSTNIQDHNAAVAKYQLRRRSWPKKK
jgi:UPF0755 protein